RRPELMLPPSTTSQSFRDRSLPGETVLLVQDIAEGAGDRTGVLDAGQLGAPCTRDVHSAEGPVGQDEAMDIAGRVAVDAGNLSAVVDANGGRARGGREGGRRESPTLERKQVRSRFRRKNTRQAGVGRCSVRRGAAC